LAAVKLFFILIVYSQEWRRLTATIDLRDKELKELQRRVRALEIGQQISKNSNFSLF